MIKSKKSGSFTGDQAHIMAKKSVKSPKSAGKFGATSSKVPTASTTTKPADRGTFMKKKGAKGLTEQKTVCKKKHSAPAISGMKKFMSEEATEKNSKATKKKSQSK